MNQFDANHFSLVERFLQLQTTEIGPLHIGHLDFSPLVSFQAYCGRVSNPSHISPLFISADGYFAAHRCPLAATGPTTVQSQPIRRREQAEPEVE